MIPFAIPAALGALKAVGLGGVVAWTKQRLTGPVMLAIGAGVLVTVTAVSIAWLVHDAKGGAQAACEADKLQAALAEARIREQQMVAAIETGRRESERLQGQARAADDEIKRLEGELGAIRETSKLETGHRPALRGDDPWLRTGPAAGSGRR